MTRNGTSLAVAAALCTLTGITAEPASAAGESNLDRLGAMKTTGTTEHTVVPQDGTNADAIRKTLEKVVLPDGFGISLYAIVPDARHMAVGTQGVVTFVGTRKNTLWAVTDRDKDRVADEVKDFAPSIAFTIPNGPCFSKDGVLYLAEQNRVLAFPAAEFFYEGPDVAVSEVVPQGELVPTSEESFNHTARVCRIGPDDRLYVSLGQPHNVTPPDKVEMYRERGIGGMLAMDRDGANREVYATGIRNSVGHDFDPATGELWFTDNQVDGMGDDIPPGEINHQTEAGQFFGHPYYGGGAVRTVEYEGVEPPADTVMPVSETVAHAADLGMIFYSGEQFPERYRGGIFSAQHGSWNRTEPVGARVMFTPVDADGDAGETVPFAEGWLDGNGEYLGRPVDVAMLRDGSLLVSDDLAGAVYRIAYAE